MLVRTVRPADIDRHLHAVDVPTHVREPPAWRRLVRDVIGVPAVRCDEPLVRSVHADRTDPTVAVLAEAVGEQDAVASRREPRPEVVGVSVVLRELHRV